VIDDILYMLYILGLGEYKYHFERTDMAGHVFGMISILEQTKKTMFTRLRDRQICLR
jgi:hypothetical protein